MEANRPRIWGGGFAAGVTVESLQARLGHSRGGYHEPAGSSWARTGLSINPPGLIRSNYVSSLAQRCHALVMLIGRPLSPDFTGELVRDRAIYLRSAHHRTSHIRVRPPTGVSNTVAFSRTACFNWPVQGKVTGCHAGQCALTHWRAPVHSHPPMSTRIRGVLNQCHDLQVEWEVPTCVS